MQQEFSISASRPSLDSLAARFVAAVRAAPDRMAVVAERASLTYAMLDEASDRLAARLAEMRIAEGSLVGVMTERTVDVAIAYLAVIKCGAAFVPLSID